MNTDIVWCIGPHQYRITLLQRMAENLEDLEDCYVVEYNLFGCNGTTVTPRPGVPNEHGWRASSEVFPATLAGLRGASLWADHLLRPQDGRND